VNFANRAVYAYGRTWVRLWRDRPGFIFWALSLLAFVVVFNMSTPVRVVVVVLAVAGMSVHYWDIRNVAEFKIRITCPCGWHLGTTDADTALVATSAHAKTCLAFQATG